MTTTFALQPLFAEQRQVLTLPRSGSKRPSRLSRRARLLAASLAANLVLATGVWWFVAERPQLDHAKLIALSTGLVELDQPNADDSSHRQFAAERRLVLLAEMQPLLGRMGQNADPSLLGVVADAFQKAGDTDAAIKTAGRIAENVSAPKALRIRAYQAMGKLYGQTIDGSPAASDSSFLAGINLVQGDTDPQSRKAAAITNIDWAGELLRRGANDRAFDRLLSALQIATDLPCGEPQRNLMLGVVYRTVVPMASQNAQFSQRLQQVTDDQTDRCVPRQS